MVKILLQLLPEIKRKNRPLAAMIAALPIRAARRRSQPRERGSSNENERKQLPIRRAERKAVQFGRMEPVHGLAFLGDGNGAGADGARDEDEADRLFRIAVEDRTEDGRVLDFEGELLPAFAREGLLGRFARLDLAARKLPEPRLGLALRPPRQKHPVAVSDHRADNVDDRPAARLAVAGRGPRHGGGGRPDRALRGRGVLRRVRGHGFRFRQRAAV